MKVSRPVSTPSLVSLRLVRSVKISIKEDTFTLMHTKEGLFCDHGESKRFLRGSTNDKTMVLNIGEAIHSDSKRMDPNIFLSNTLVIFYGKCGMVPDAENVFAALVQRSTVSWNVMISAYIECGDGEKALLMYRQMQSEGVHPDQRTLSFALQACKLLIEGEDFHVENRYEFHSFGNRESFTC